MESNVTGDFMLSLGMDLNRVLVVVFSMVVSELSHVHTRPIDFVCDSEARRVMNKVKDLQEEKVQERRAEILLSLGTLAQDVRSARTLSQPGCGLTLLKRLEHSINNYLYVVRLLHVEGEQEGPAVERCLGQPSKDLGLVLKYFGLLLTGKLELLIAEMAKWC
ncbi:thrombopoietin isoform X3 [Danio rerio]|uniref:Thrombopoietin isoform X3 n=1 Tax=Danio rerio TaxID=7955 RepID=A0AC58GCN1_DANRE